MCQICGLPPGGHGLVTQLLGLATGLMSIVSALCVASLLRWRYRRRLEQKQGSQAKQEKQTEHVGSGGHENS